MHYRIFDLWRFVAALLIMGYHFLYFAPIELWRVLGPVAQRPQGLLDLFFMISGFLVMARYGARMTKLSDYGRFLRRRAAMLYPLHLVTLCFFAAIALAASSGLIAVNDPARWDLSQLPAHLLLIHAWGVSDRLAFNVPSWSVSAEFFCYLLFPVLLLVHRRTGTKGLVALLLVWIAVIETMWAAGRLGDDHWSRANNFGAYRAFVGFTAGAIMAVAAERLRLPLRTLWPAQAALVVAVAAMLAEAHPVLPLLGLAAALFLAASAETTRPALTDGLRRWSPLLRLSFGIYLWHMVLGAIFYQVVWNRFLLDMGPLAFLLFSLLPMVSTIAVAALSARFEIRAYTILSGARPHGRLVPA